MVIAPKKLFDKCLANDESTGVGGGSEQWEYNVGEAAVAMVAAVGKPEVKQEFLDTFNRKKGMLGPGIDKGFNFVWDSDGSPTSIMISTEKLQKCFAAALKPTLETAESRVQELKTLRGVDFQVVVSGGTARHQALKENLRDICRNNGIPEPIFTDNLDITFE